MPALPKCVLAALLLACAARGGDGFTGPIAGEQFFGHWSPKISRVPLFAARVLLYDTVDM